ncbi:TonB-dependent receptor domain-containing protein [Cerasicoccus maritimus]|uniref:TonB-dependent receptor domain-containing protein n=1 Tax=Cerasicoccus maritimus TaxID=490089 RepID=UPI0028528C80|nr:TonB-dependent receptor [Cerasicoccus maritimus]
MPLHNFLLRTLILTLCSVTGYLFAEEPEIEQPDEPLYELEPVYLTGSLFIPHESELIKPITILSAEDMQLMGIQRPIEALRLQPMIFGAMNTANNNDSSGASSPNIHGVGTLRTLNLINGRRAGGNSAFWLEPGGFANLNLIPQSAINRIDILQQSASTTYGSDAIAGAINVDLIRRFEGVEVDALYGDTTDGGGQTQQYSLKAGFKLDEDTHLTVLGSFYDQRAVWARDRSLSASTDYSSRGGVNRGSSTFPGRATIQVGGTPQVSILAPGVPFPTSAASYVPYNHNTDSFNYNAYSADIPAQEITNAYAAIEHDLTDWVTLYGDVLYAYNTFESVYAPAPWSPTPGTSLFNAVVNSPHAPVPAASISSVSYRSFELGNLTNDIDRNAVRTVGGARGLIDNRWEWDTAALYTQTSADVTVSGIADARLLIPYINSGQFNPYARSTTGVNGGIAFDNATALRAAATTAKNKYFENLFSYDGKVSGSLFELPAGDLTSAIGAEYRYESIDVNPDSLWASYQNLGATGFTQPFSGKRNVFAIFNETHVPIISKHHKILGLQQVDLNLGFRYEDFSDQGVDPKTSLDANNHYNNFSWDAAISIKPVEQLTLLAGYSTGFRAPTLFESYSSSVFDYPILVDPTGITPPGTAIPTLIQGNPYLEPEVSQSWNASGIWKPEFVNGLTFRVDYYYVNVDNAIANGAQFTLNQNSPTEVIRDSSGNILLVNSQFFNASRLTTQGMDYTIEYSHDFTDAVTVVTTLTANQVLSYDAVVPGVGELNFLGNYIDKRTNNLSPGAIPRWRGLASVFAYVYDASLGVTVQYIDSYNDDPNFTAGNQPRRVNDYTTVNLVANYDFKDSSNMLLRNLTLTVGVDNVFDTSPPFAAGAYADGYDTSLYTIRNRFVFGSVSKKF